MYSQIDSHTIDSCQSPLNYEPEIWNSLDKNAHEINNCYSYIFNRVEKNREEKLQPGDLSSGEFNNYNCEEIISKVDQDFEQSGLTKLNNINDPINCTHYKIALVIDNKGDKLDYHFYRQDNNGYWSHKTGHDPVSNVDASGKLITNPETCDRNYDKKKNDEFNYEIFCGYYAVKYNGGPFTFD